MTVNPSDAIPADNTHHLALIIDGTVVNVLHTNEELAAILLSRPVVVELAEKDGRIRTGDFYDAGSKTFRFAD